MSGVQRRFAEHQHHAATFFQAHVRSAHDQFFVKTVGDAGEGFD